MRSSVLRQRLAVEAARIMAEQGGQDCERARRKAARRLGVGNPRHWPKNTEVLAALREHQRLFGAPERPSELRQVRERALQAMQAFSDFRPRLVGPAVEGTADRGTGARLYVFADTPDEIQMALMAQRIPWRQGNMWLRYSGGARREHPIYRFEAGGVAMELLVLPPLALRDPPLNPVTERPDKGATTTELRHMLDNDSAG